MSTTLSTEIMLSYTVVGFIVAFVFGSISTYPSGTMTLPRIYYRDVAPAKVAPEVYQCEGHCMEFLLCVQSLIPRGGYGRHGGIDSVLGGERELQRVNRFRRVKQGWFAAQEMSS